MIRDADVKIRLLYEEAGRGNVIQNLAAMQAEISRLDSSIARLGATQNNQHSDLMSNTQRELGILEKLESQWAQTFTAMRQATNPQDVVRYRTELGDLERQIRELSGGVDKAKNSNDGFAGSLRGVGQLIAGAFALDAIKDFTGKVFDLTASYESSTAALTNVYGSSKKATEAMQMLQKFADQTNFTMSELSESFIKMANRGLAVGKKELVAIGDVANTLKKPFNDVSEAILDVSNSERWTELGIKASTNGDKVTLSFKGVNQTVEKTEQGVLSAMVAFSKLQGVQGQTAAQAETLSGKYSTMKDAFDGVFRAIGDNAAPVFRGFIGLGTELATTLTEVIRESSATSSTFTKTSEVTGRLSAATGFLRDNLGLILTLLKTGISTFIAYEVITRGAAVAKTALTVAGNLYARVQAIEISQFTVGNLVAQARLVIDGERILITQALTGSTNVLTAAETRAAVAAKAFNASLGLIAIAVGAVVAIYQIYSESLEESTAKQKELNTNVINAVAPLQLAQREFNNLANEVLRGNAPMAEQAQRLLDLKAKYPDILKGVTSLSEAERILKENKIDTNLQMEYRKGKLEDLKAKYPEVLKGVSTLGEAEAKLGTIIRDVNGDFVVRARLLENEVKMDMNKATATEAIKAKIELEKELMSASTKRVQLAGTTGVQELASEAENIKQKIANQNKLINESLKFNDNLAMQSARLTKQIKFDWAEQNNEAKKATALTADQLEQRAKDEKKAQVEAKKARREHLQEERKDEKEAVDYLKTLKLESVENVKMVALKELLLQQQHIRETVDKEEKRNKSLEKSREDYVKAVMKLEDKLMEDGLKKQVEKIGREVKDIKERNKQIEEAYAQFGQKRLIKEKELNAELDQIEQDRLANIVELKKKLGIVDFITQEQLNKQKNAVGLWLSNYTNAIKEAQESTRKANSADAKSDIMSNILGIDTKRLTQDIDNVFFSIKKIKEAGGIGKAINAAKTPEEVGKITGSLNIAVAVGKELIGAFISAAKVAFDFSDSLRRSAQVYQTYTNQLVDDNRASLVEILDDESKSWKDREGLVNQYAKREKELLSTNVRVQASMEWHAKEIDMVKARTDRQLQVMTDMFTDPVKGVFSLLKYALNERKQRIFEETKAVEQQKIDENNMRIEALKKELETQREITNAKKRALSDELANFKEAKNLEIEKAKEAADAQKESFRTVYEFQKDGIQKQLEAVKEAKAQESEAVKTAYENQKQAAKDALDAEKQAIKDKTDFKLAELEREKGVEIANLDVLDTLRNEALGRWFESEKQQIEFKKQAALAKAQSEKERVQIEAKYGQELLEAIKQFEDAKIDKALAVKLATVQIKKDEKAETISIKASEKTQIQALDDDYQAKFKALANERDLKLKQISDAALATETDLKGKLTVLENNYKADVARLQGELTATINKFKGEILGKDESTKAEMKRLDAELREQERATRREILEAQKQIAIAQLRMEIATLRSKKWFLNAGKIDSAIAEITNLIYQIEGGASKIEGPGGIGNIEYSLPQSGLDGNVVVQPPSTAGAAAGGGTNPISEENVAIMLTSAGYQKGAGASEIGNQAIDPDAYAAGPGATGADGHEKPMGKVLFADGVENLFYEKQSLAGVDWFRTIPRFQFGTEFVDGVEGIDQIIARLTRGERVVEEPLNRLTGKGVSNADLILGWKNWQTLNERTTAKATALTPKALPVPSALIAQNFQMGEDLKKMMLDFKEALSNQSKVEHNYDEAGYWKSIEKGNAKIYRDNERFGR